MRQMISGLILSARSKVGLKDPWYSNEAESANQLLKSHNYNVNSQKLQGQWLGNIHKIVLGNVYNENYFLPQGTN